MDERTCSICSCRLENSPLARLNRLFTGAHGSGRIGRCQCKFAGAAEATRKRWSAEEAGVGEGGASSQRWIEM